MMACHNSPCQLWSHSKVCVCVCVHEACLLCVVSCTCIYMVTYAVQYLLDQSDFLVVGVVGRQGVGKSSVMSLLAGSRTGSGKPAMFRPETREVWESESYQTTGLDMAITPERVILLDTQVHTPNTLA